MEKQKKKGRRKLLWILLAVGIVLLAAAASVLYFFVFHGNAEPDAGPKLYWNVERSRYVAKGVQGTSSRTPESDGYYYLKMAVGGEQIDVKVADPDVVNRIDFQELMGLEFDDKGIVTDVLSVDEVTGGIVANKYVVESISDGKLVVNTSVTYKGISVTFEVGAYTNFWEIGDFEPLVGLATTPVEGDTVTMVEDEAGRITDVFVFPFEEPGDVYWNITRMYDSTLKVTTREPDALGYYVYEFAVNGEIVTLKTHDKEVADYIDAHVSQNMGFNFDEDGNIIEVLNAGNVVCGGGLITGTQYLLAQNGNDITMGSYSSSTDSVTTITETVSKDCKIFDVSGQGAYVGQPITEIRYGDRLICLRDRRYQVCVIFVAGRLTDNSIYWVTERNQVWDRTNWVTTRQPAEDGWYYLKLAVDGEEIVAKTQNAELVNTIDSYVCWCMELNEDNEILSVLDGTNRYGGGMFAPFYTVTAVENGVVTAVSGTSTQSGRLSEDVKIYNISSSAVMMGEPTDVQVGDTIYGYRDVEGMVRHIFIYSRAYDGRIYWNVSRLYDSTNKVTTRQPDGEGRYWFELVVDGQVRWLWTDSVDIATTVDSVVTRARGLKVSGDRILGVLAPTSLASYEGVVPDASWVTVQSVSGNAVTAVNSQKETVTITLSADCLIYNVTNVYTDHRGELTSIRAGDVLVTLADAEGEAVIAYVCGGRTREFHTDSESCPCNGDAQWVAWDGTTPLTAGCYYLTQDITAPAEGWTVSGMSVYLRLDGHTISGTGRVFTVANNGTLSVCDHGTRGTIRSTALSGGAGGVIQVSSSTATVNLYNIDLRATGGGSSAAENGGVLAVSGWTSLYNVNVSGGNASKKGGNIAVMPTGALRMFGGTVSGGVSKLDGGNLYVAGNAYLENVTVTGGTSENNAGSVGASVKDKIFMISGGKITDTRQGLYLIAGELVLKGSANISGNTDYNLKLGKEATLNVTGLSKNAKVGVTMVQVGTFAQNAASGLADAFVSDSQDLYVVHSGQTLSLAYVHTHCACAGTLAGHSCETAGYVGLSQAAVTDATEKTTPIKRSGTNLFLSAGSYYLTEDIQLPGQFVISGQVTLCLNGHTLSAAQSRVLAINGGTVNITDCRDGGSMVGGTTTFAATVLLQGSKGTNQGTLGAVNIYAGTIVGGTTTRSTDGQGGNIYVWGGTLNVYGGELVGGTAVGSGGNVILARGQSMNVYGGRITAGTAPRGKCIYIVGDARLSLSGTVRIDDIAWTEATPLNISGLKSDSQVGLTLTKEMTFAENAATDLSAVFAVPSTGEIRFDSGSRTLSYRFDHAHCVCGGLEDHGCTNIPMAALTQSLFDSATETSAPLSVNNGTYTLAAGSYYLKEDIALSGQILVVGTVNLCLNDHSLTASASRAFAVSGGTLNITDCGTAGKIQGGQAAFAGTILIQSNKGNSSGKLGTVNIYSGTVAGGKTTNAQSGQGGNIYLIGGTLNVYGGTLIGGNAAGQGGNVIVFAEQTLNLYGGELTSGTAYSGNCLYVVKGANVTLDGDVAVEAIHLSGGALNIVTLPEGFTTKLSSSYQGVFAENVTADYSGCFRASGARITYSPEDKTLSFAYDHYHCFCGEALESHAHSSTAYMSLTQADFDNAAADTYPVSKSGSNFSLAAGSYYLAEDIQLPGQILITGTTVKANLCLNGHSMAASASRVIAVNGAALNLTDCGTDGQLLGGRTANSATILVQVGGTLNIWNGTVRGGETTDKLSGYGGNISLTKGTVNIYGGTVVGGTALTTGGAVYVADNQTLNIWGGSLTSGTAAVGSCLYAGKDAKVTLNGQMQISEIYLDGGKLEPVALGEDFTAALAVSEQGVFAENVTADYSGCFRASGARITYSPEDKTLSFAYDHYHCFCGEALESHAHSSTAYMALTQADFDNAAADTYPVSKSGSNFSLAAGSYYLAEDIQLPGQILITGTTVKVNLCLNGHSMAASASRVIAVNGAALNLTDCGTDGQLLGGRTANSATILVQVGGTLNIWNGTVRGGETTDRLSGHGGNISLTKGTVNIYGGTVVGGTALTTGGAVYVADNQTLNIWGGSLTSGTAAAGDCVYTAKGAAVTVGGQAVVEDIYLADGATVSVNADKPLETASVGISMENPGVFASEVLSDCSSVFTSNMEGQFITYDPEAKTLILSHTHCLCAQKLEGHSCANIQWTGLTQADFTNATTTSSPVKKSGSNFNLVAGSYYLTEDIDLTGQIVLTVDVDLCLSGHSLNAPASSRAFAINGTRLNLTDCGTTGNLVGGTTTSGATVYIQLSGSMVLYSGTVVGGTTTSSFGGAIAVQKGNLTMYGGTVLGGSSKTIGGAITVNTDQTFHFFGGTVTSGTAGEGRGACIYVAATASVTVGGTAQADEIYLAGTAKLSLNADHPLEKPALIGINMANVGVFLANTETDLSEFFKSTLTGKEIIWSPSAKTMALGEPQQEGDSE